MNFIWNQIKIKITYSNFFRIILNIKNTEVINLALNINIKIPFYYYFNYYFILKNREHPKYFIIANNYY